MDGWMDGWMNGRTGSPLHPWSTSSGSAFHSHNSQGPLDLVFLLGCCLLPPLKGYNTLELQMWELSLQLGRSPQGASSHHAAQRDDLK